MNHRYFEDASDESPTKQLFGFKYTQDEEQRISAAQRAAVEMFQRGYGAGSQPCSAVLNRRAYVTADTAMLVADNVADEPPEQPPQGVKQCKRCFRILPFSDFCRCTRSLDGFQRWCKQCNNSYRKEYNKAKAQT